MKNVVLIGCGNIGTRLLQSLVTLPILDPDDGISVLCVDPDSEGRERAMLRAGEAFDGNIPGFVNVDTAATFEDFSGEIDLAIVSTTSRPRFEIVKSLFETSPPRRLLLEKFLFVQPHAYEEVATLLQKHDVKCWVHAPRPAWPGYVHLKERLTDCGSIQMRVGGAAWAMASNAIHFVAAFNSLTGEQVAYIDASRLDPNPIPNKREPYLEVTGGLRFIGTNNSMLELDCRRGGRSAIAVDIMTDKGHYIIFEGEGRMFANDQHTDWSWREEKFETLFASQMQAPLTDLLTRDECLLPTYRDMVDPHQKLIQVFNPIFFPGESELQDCPVT